MSVPPRSLTPVSKLVFPRGSSNRFTSLCGPRSELKSGEPAAVFAEPERCGVNMLTRT